MLLRGVSSIFWTIISLYAHLSRRLDVGVRFCWRHTRGIMLAGNGGCQSGLTVTNRVYVVSLQKRRFPVVGNGSACEIARRTTIAMSTGDMLPRVGMSQSVVAATQRPGPAPTATTPAFVQVTHVLTSSSEWRNARSVSLGRHKPDQQQSQVCAHSVHCPLAVPSCLSAPGAFRISRRTLHRLATQYNRTHRTSGYLLSTSCDPHC